MTNKLKKLTIILYTGDKEKINYALSIVATAAALERSTELFFTGKSIQFLMANNKDSNYNHANSEELLSAIINLGGIANICYSHKKELIAFDLGPGNVLIDDLMYHFYKKNYDKNGALNHQ